MKVFKIVGGTWKAVNEWSLLSFIYSLFSQADFEFFSCICCYEKLQENRKIGC